MTVLPATTSLESIDIGMSAEAGFLVAMKQAVKPVGEARDGYETFADIAAHFGVRANFAEGRSALVEIEQLDGPLPTVTAFDPPRFVQRPKVATDIG